MTGRWRIYEAAEHIPVRDAMTRSIVTFNSLAEARHWWSRVYPEDADLKEAPACARCGGYFGRVIEAKVIGGR